MKAGGAALATVVSQGGVSALVTARKEGFATAATEPETVFADAEIDAVVVATRHDSHARLTLQALQAGKSVFVEKPLALTEADLDEIEAARAAAPNAPIVAVGFNRRFAPLTRKMKSLLDGTTGPRTFIATVNAGEIPADHWTQDPAVGGGRIIGEACHFIDLLRYLAGHPIVSMTSVRAGGAGGDDKATITLSFADGSHGTIHYFANGSKAFAKERIEAFAGGRILQIDNFRALQGWGVPGFSKASSRQDKGHAACAAAFVAAVRDGGEPPIAFDELIEISRWSIRAAAFAD